MLPVMVVRAEKCQQQLWKHLLAPIAEGASISAACISAILNLTTGSMLLHHRLRDQLGDKSDSQSLLVILCVQYKDMHSVQGHSLVNAGHC